MSTKQKKPKKQVEKNKNKLYCVYIHTNNVDNKKYIGQTCKSPNERWSNGYGYRYNKHFFSAILKYGWDNFDHKIVANGLTKEEADTLEKTMIKKYNTQNAKYGYNITAGGSGSLGYKKSEETKQKLRAGKLGEKNPMYHKHLSEEIRRKMSISRSGAKHFYYGKHRSEETKQKIGEKNSGTNSYRARKINQYDLDGNFIKTWDYITEASRALNLNKSSISNCCAGRKKSAGGYLWRYYDDK